jgi:hypothetical protein
VSGRDWSVSGRDWTVNSIGCTESRVKLDSQQNRRLYRVLRPVDVVKQAGETGEQVVMLS